MTAADPGRVLRRALIAWGLGHLLLGGVAVGRALLITEILAALLVAWLTIGLADTSAYLVPFLAGVAFLVAWAWQAVDAYRMAESMRPGHDAAPERSPAAAMGWLSLPLLAWATGFWIIAAGSATPAAALDRFVAAWTTDRLEDGWPDEAVDPAEAATRSLGTDADRFRDVRVRIVSEEGRRATAVAEAIHYERRETSFLWVFPGRELVPVADDAVLAIDLAARTAELPGGGDIGAVRWEVVDAAQP